MRILALTTATPRFEACLFDGGVIATTCYEDELAHAERCMLAIDGMFRGAGVDPSWIEALACDIGPGSFTGVRVGLATAKGIALARDVPLVGVSSLEAMAAAAFAEDVEVRRVACVLDAKRGERFVAVHERGAAQGKARVVGEALVGETIGDATRIDAPPRAEWIARLAEVRLRDGVEIGLDEVEPIYAREPDAKKPTQPPRLSRA